ncbi:MAG: response regulator [Phycisphaerae bacterium]|jgi:CheY-like chemotaxis protein/anti-sigma regulatory factor (Ser/Thr protein kinase)|nr:response regulator [Phycisphaerae bacterium]
MSGHTHTSGSQVVRVLVVEDCQASAHLASALIRKAGAVCDVADCGTDATRRLRAERYDAVLMDCGLPDIDGYEVTRRIRCGECGSDRERIPIYAFTADADAETRFRCAAAGMNGFLSKPIVRPELDALLRSLSGEIASREPERLAERTESPSEAATFDVDALLDRVAGDCSLAIDVVASLLVQLPSQIREIQSSIDAVECPRVASLAHQLKGAVGSIGGERLRRMALQVESAGHAGDVATLRRLAPAMDDAVRELVEAIEASDLNDRCSDMPPPSDFSRPDSVKASTVLVVEDDPTLRTMLVRILERSGHVVVAADAAETAYERLVEAVPSVIECVVTDYRMPGESGLDLIASVRRSDPTVASILMTADGEQRIVADSMRAGAFDFLEKPIDARRLCAAVDAAIQQTREQRRTAEVRSGVAAMGKTQAQMLRSQGDCSIPIELSFFPKLDAGGDFFSQFQLGEKRVICLLTDVSGHDLQAAYLSAYFHGMTRGMLTHAATAREVFDLFNRFLVSEWNASGEQAGHAERQLASVAVSSLVIDTEVGSVESLTCGAPAPSRIDNEGRISVIGERGGAPLGWFDEVTAATSVASIDGGGEILMWSDGLDELAQSVGASVLSAAYLVCESRRNGKSHPLIEHAGDDILVVSISLNDGQAPEERFQPLLMWRYRGNQSAEIDDLVAYWRRSLRLALPGLVDGKEHDIILATREAVLNAMTHGCGEREDGIAKLQIAYRASTRTIRVWVEDSGSGHAFDRAAHEQSAGDGLVTEHRGLTFIHFLASAVRYERNGASLMMDFVL